MGLRDRLEAGATRVGASARGVAASSAVELAGDRFRGLRGLVKSDDEQLMSGERFLLAIVRAVRDDDRHEDRSLRDVFETARRRRRRLGLASFGAGPLIGVANQLSDLYCETATVCDLADVHDLKLADEQIAAHMLFLWSVTESLEEAQAAVDGNAERSVAAILATKLGERVTGNMPDKLTKRSATKALWDARGLAKDARTSAGSGAIGAVVFTGHRTKQIIKKAEGQLGVRHPPREVG